MEEYERLLDEYIINKNDSELEAEAQRKVKLQLYMERYRLKLQTGMVKLKVYDDVVQLRQQIAAANPDKDAIAYWLTINPAPTVTLDEFKKITSKCFTKKWLQKFVYVYEQRGTTIDDIHGFHLHAIIYKPLTKKYSQFKSEITNTLSGLCDLSNINYFQFVGIYDETQLLIKYNYILGTKVSTDHNRKDLKQKIDPFFREQNALSRYYNLGDHIPSQFL